MFESSVKYNKLILGICVGAVASVACYMLMPQNADAQLPEVNDADENTEEEKVELKKHCDAVLVTRPDGEQGEITPATAALSILAEEEHGSGDFFVVPRENANEAAAPVATTENKEPKDKDSSAARDEEGHGSGNFVVVNHADTDDEVSAILGTSGGQFFAMGSGGHP